MHNKSILMVIAVMCLSLALASCAKKRTEPLPPGATKVEVKEDPVDWGQTETRPSGPSESELQSQQMAQAVREMGNVIYFEFDSSALTEHSRAVLSSKADILKRYSGLTLVIEGHCDERGTTEYNLALGERRARVAYDYLVILGVSPDRLSIVSFGEERPADAGHTEEAWSKNRRDEFRIFE
ncbi:MAG: peptidoglycan-associated lipoprotein Pal [Desulfovibrionaceae bacterium]|jgi:peptidoglycan-associated lipoprotein